MHPVISCTTLMNRGQTYKWQKESLNVVVIESEI